MSHAASETTTVEDEPVSTNDKLTPYTFDAEPKHAKYGLRPGALYRAMRNSRGRTIGRPVLVHDPSYGSMQPTLRGMIPFSRPLRWVMHNDKTGAMAPVADDDPAWQNANKAVNVIDLSLAVTAIAALGAAVIALA